MTKLIALDPHVPFQITPSNNCPEADTQMNYASIDTIRSGHGQVERALDALRSLAGACARRRRKAKAIAELHALSDRSLADIGIPRSDIELAIRSGAKNASRRHR